MPFIGGVTTFQSVSESKLFDQLWIHFSGESHRQRAGKEDQPANHVDIFEIFIVLSSFDEEDLYVGVFC